MHERTRMKHLRSLLVLVTLGSIVLLASSCRIRAGTDDGGSLPIASSEGVEILFAGHSFFIPIAKSFEVLAREQGLLSSQDIGFVFAGGAAGLPGALWQNASRKSAIEAALSTGQVELFGLTGFGDSLGSFEDYERWFDLALGHNPQTTFFIGQPWMVRGPSLETAAFDLAIETTAQRLHEVVIELRDAYPDNTILFLNYGKVSSVMMREFEEGMLPDIEGLVPDPLNGVSLDEALFSDAVLGHAGPMMTQLTALTWIDLLLGADIGSFNYSDYESDVEAILQEVLLYNEQYLDAP